MSEENKLQSMVVKTLRDENGNLFAPVTTYKALINEEGQSLSSVLDEKIDFSDLKSGDNITITIADGYLPIEVGTDLSGASCVFNLDSFKVIDLNNNPYSGIETEVIQSAAGTTGGMSIRRGYILKTPTSSVYFEISTNSSRYTWYNIYINCSGVITHILENTTAYNGSGFDNDIVVKNGRYDFPIDFGSITEVISSNLASGIIIKEPKSATISASSNYEEVTNKPSINSVELLGNKTHTDLGLQPAGDYALNSRVNELEDKIDDIDAIQKQSAQAIGYNSYQHMIGILNGAEKEEYIVGQSIFIKTDGVPDVWVFAVNEESITYTYSSDSAVQQALASATGLRVGYYTLAPLETEKVDLTNYVEFNDAPTATKAGVIKIADDSGVNLNKGVIYTTPATEAQITAKEDEHTVITPANLETAVKSIISKTSDLVNDSDFTSKDYVDSNVLDKIEEYINANQESLTGESGVYVGPEAPTNPFVNVWIDTDDTIGGYDYDSLDNRPMINGVTLEGNKTGEELGLSIIPEFILENNLTPEAVQPIFDYWYNTRVMPIVRITPTSDRSWRATHFAVESTYSDTKTYNMYFVQERGTLFSFKTVSLGVQNSTNVVNWVDSNFSNKSTTTRSLPYPYGNSNSTSSVAFLSTSNESSYTPSKDYNPATKKYVDDKIKETVDLGYNIVIVDELPTENISSKSIYFVPIEENTGNAFDEYVYLTNGEWEKIGSTAVDMSNYYSKAEVDAKIEELRSLISLATSEDIQNILTPQPEEEPGDEGIDEGVDM